MITIEKIDTHDKAQVKQFVRFPFDLYANCPQWVPPLIGDAKFMLNREKHPFYERSDADYFLAYKDGKVAARLGVIEHKPFNQYHNTNKATFTLFDCIDDQEVADAIFGRAFEWARARGLTEILGPKGLCSFDGYGILIEGFEYRQMMTMSSYNYPYYPKLMENLKFEKEVDFVSCYLPSEKFNLPEKAQRVAERVIEKGSFKVKNFSSKRELKSYAKQIGEAYNKTFINNWEYYPLSQGEVDYLLANLMTVLDPKLIKIITFEDKIVGFLVGFTNISGALQRMKGRITPWGLIDLMLEMRKAKFLDLNGAGVLPEYHGRGGNALLYSEMYKTMLDSKFAELELSQVAETAVQMRKDLKSVGGEEYKNHRVYRRAL